MIKLSSIITLLLLTHNASLILMYLKEHVLVIWIALIIQIGEANAVDKFTLQIKGLEAHLAICVSTMLILGTFKFSTLL